MTASAFQGFTCGRQTRIEPAVRFIPGDVQCMRGCVLAEAARGIPLQLHEHLRTLSPALRIVHVDDAIRLMNEARSPAMLCVVESGGCAAVDALVPERWVPLQIRVGIEVLRNSMRSDSRPGSYHGCVSSAS